MLGLKRVLGLGSYETAWSLLHKLRRAMVRPGRDRLAGELEVDESYAGRRLAAGKRGRGAAGKVIVAIAVEVLPRLQSVGGFARAQGRGADGSRRGARGRARPDRASARRARDEAHRQGIPRASIPGETRATHGRVSEDATYYKPGTPWLENLVDVPGCRVFLRETLGSVTVEPGRNVPVEERVSFAA